MRLFLLPTLTMVAFAANSVLNRMALADGSIDATSFGTIRLISGALMLAGLSLVLRGGIGLRGPGRLVGVLSLLVYGLGPLFANRSPEWGRPEGHNRQLRPGGATGSPVDWWSNGAFENSRKRTALSGFPAAFHPIPCGEPAPSGLLRALGKRPPPPAGYLETRASFASQQPARLRGSNGTCIPTCR